VLPQLNVQLPAGLICLGERAFGWCVGLRAMTVPRGVSAIPERAFQFAGLTTFLVSDRVTTIGKRALASSKITELDLPIGLSAVDEGGMEKMLALRRLSLGDKVAWGKDALAGTTSIQQLVLHGYENSASWGTVLRRAVTMDARIWHADRASKVLGLAELGSFEERKDLLVIREGVARWWNVRGRSSTAGALRICGSAVIEDGAFAGFTSLVEVDLSASVLEDLPAESFCESAVARVTLSSRIETIGSRCFAECRALARIDLTAVRKIENEAFKGCTFVDDRCVWAKIVRHRRQGVRLLLVEGASLALHFADGRD
jgi:hypothetical protein